MRTFQHIARFRCTGSACEDTCCAAWGIEVPADSWAHIQALEGIDPAEAVVLYPPAAQTPARVGRLRMGAGGCALLSGEGLCRLQQARGEGAIPPTCASYPRSLSVHPGGAELSGFLSCPEVARLALLAPDGMDWAPQPPPPPPHLNTDLTIEREGPYYALLGEVRARLAALGEGRPLAARLWLLAHFAARSVAPFSRHAREGESALALLDQFETPALQEEILAGLPAEPHPATAAAFLAHVATLASENGRFRQPQARVLAALRAYGEGPGEPLAALAGWQAARARWPAQEAALAEPLAAYLRHQLLTRWYTEYPDLALYTQHLLTKLAFVRFLVLADPGPAPGSLIAAVYSVDRLVEHSAWGMQARAALGAAGRPFLGLAGDLITL